MEENTAIFNNAAVLISASAAAVSAVCALLAFLFSRRSKTSESFQFLGAELKETADETLFLELALRGYDLSSLRENNDETAEIVKIG